MIKNITIKIHLGNNSMKTTEDVIDLLRCAISYLEDKRCDQERAPFDTLLRDNDGNCVGFIKAYE